MGQARRGRRIRAVGRQGADIVGRPGGDLGSLAIVEWLADKTDRARYWPKDEIARGMARSMAAEMHSSYPNLRRECSMNVRKQFPPGELSEEVRTEIVRILELWAQARARHGGGGPYLFGTFGAVDIMFAPVVTRFVTYSIPVPRFAAAYMEAMLNHPWMREWIEAAQEEPWVIEQYETPSERAQRGRRRPGSTGKQDRSRRRRC